MAHGSNPYESPEHAANDQTPYGARVLLAIACSGIFWPPFVRFIAVPAVVDSTSEQQLNQLFPYLIAAGLLVIVWCMISVIASTVCVMKPNARIAGGLLLAGNIFSLLLLC